MRIGLGISINSFRAAAVAVAALFSMDFSKPENSGYIATWSEDF